MKAVLLALATFAFLWANVEAYPSPNTMSNVLLAYRFVTEGSGNIGGFDDVPAGYLNWDKTLGFPENNRYAPGTSVVLSPAVGVAIAVGVRPEDVVAWSYVDKLVATLLIAVAAAATFAAARRLSSEGAASVATFAAIAGTSIATVAGQRAWQHPLGVAAVAIAWLWVVRGQRDARWLARAGLPLAIAVTARYPLGVIWIACLLYVVIAHRRLVLPYLLWSAGPFLFLALYTTVAFGSPTENSYGPQLWQWAGMLGLPGNLISPSRGVLVFSPFLVAGLWVIGRRLWRREPMWIFAAASLVAMWVVHGIYIGWWGGWSYGNRYFVEVVPILASAVAIAWYHSDSRTRGWLMAAIVVAVVFQLAGMLAYYRFWDGYTWDDARQRTDPETVAAMWDLFDPQWWWTIRAAIAMADVRAVILIPVTLAFGYVALRSGLARPAMAQVARPAAAGLRVV